MLEKLHFPSSLTAPANHKLKEINKKCNPKGVVVVVVVVVVVFMVLRWWWLWCSWGCGGGGGGGGGVSVSVNDSVLVRWYV